MESKPFTVESLGKDIRRLERRLMRIEAALNTALRAAMNDGSNGGAEQTTPAQALNMLGIKRLPAFARDGEVFAMVHAMALSGYPIDAILAKAISAFGSERAPSRTAIGRYRKRVLDVSIY